LGSLMFSFCNLLIKSFLLLITDFH
jgi:hypothetical protein